jgi:Terminase small subunit
MPKITTSKYLKPQAISAFGVEFLRNGGNATLAVKSVWPDDKLPSSRAAQIGSRLRKTPEIVRIVGEMERKASVALTHAVERFKATPERAADELVRMAFAQVRDVADWGTEPDPKDPKLKRQFLRVRDSVEISDEIHRAVVEVSQRVDGTITIKLGDKQAAIMNLARLKGWIADKPQDVGQSVSLIIQR